MSNSFTTKTEESWFSRIGKAFVGIPIGLLLFFGAMPLLFWNENNTIRVTQSLAEGRSSTVEGTYDAIKEADNDKLVHIVGKTATDDTLRDDEFPAEANALWLRREVEMYQWVEKIERKEEKKVGGGTTTTETATYSKAWESGRVNSDSFKQPEKYRNPPLPYSNESWHAENVAFGAHQLTDEMVKKIQNFEPLELSADFKEQLPPDIAERAAVSGNTLLIGETGPPNADEPQLGDIRIRFAQVPAGMVSVIAQQSGEAFRPYMTKAQRDINLVMVGDHSIDAMFTQAESENTFMAFALRILGCVMMVVGVSMVLAPLNIFADFLPFLGSISRFGTGIIAFVVGVGTALVVIAIAWIAVRPLLAIGLIVAVIALVVAAFMLWPKRKRPEPAVVSAQ